MAIEALIFKGTGRGARRELAVSIPHGMGLDELLAGLRSRLQESQGFFRGTPVVLTGRPLTAAERQRVGELMAEFGMVLVDSPREDNNPPPARAGLTGADRHGGDGTGGRRANVGTDGERLPEQASRGAPRDGEAVVEPPDDDCTLLVRRTLRSGQKVFYSGHVVILGDVNPGAVVTCTGDIVVMGRLRGVAHAGAGGNVHARVMALRLQPTQLRIAHVISRAPDDADEGPGWPEVAVINDGVIEIQAFTP